MAARAVRTATDGAPDTGTGPLLLYAVKQVELAVRAHLDEDCPALDFYRGFYLQVQDDHLCAHRDAIHSRMGGSCTIDKFKQLVPKLPR